MTFSIMSDAQEKTIDLNCKEKVEAWVFIKPKGKSETYVEISYSKNRHHRNGIEVAFHQTLTSAPTYCRVAGNKVGYWMREKSEKW